MKVNECTLPKSDHIENSLEFYRKKYGYEVKTSFAFAEECPESGTYCVDFTTAQKKGDRYGCRRSSDVSKIKGNKSRMNFIMNRIRRINDGCLAGIAIGRAPPAIAAGNTSVLQSLQL